MTNIETLRWNEDHLEMINQRILPEDFQYISYYSASSVSDGIRSMVVRGTPEFDLTPAGLVSGLITEKGIVYNPDTKKISNLFRR